MAKDNQPICLTCGIPLTVEHIITECRSYEEDRILFNISNNLAEALGPNSTSIDNLYKFLIKTQLFVKL